MDRSGIYVDLDALLDTRLAALIALLGELDPYVLVDKGYLEREDDFMSRYVEVCDNLFAETYAKRATALLEKSSLTNVIFAVRDEILELLSDVKLSDGLVVKPVVSVNVYPYQLDELSKELMREALSQQWGTDTEIKFIRRSPAELKPVEIKSTWISIWMYDFSKWAELHHTVLESFSMPETVFHIPRLRKIDRDAELEMVAKLKDSDERKVYEDMDPFELMVIFAFGRLTLDYRPVSLFSIMNVTLPD